MGIIGLLGSVSLVGDLVKVPYTPVASGTSLQAAQPQKSQKGVVRRSPIDIPRSLQRRNARAERREFERFNQERRKQYVSVFEQSILAN
jgi:hypothetical protein